MRVFDFNVHLPYKVDKNIDNMVFTEMNISVEHLRKTFLKFNKSVNNTSFSANYMFFNSNIIYDNEITILINEIKQKSKGAAITLLYDFRNKNNLEYLHKIKGVGVDMIKFHSYQQKIKNSEFKNIVNICKIAEQLKLPICFDASYGSLRMYDYDNLKLIIEVAKVIDKVPIIILHSGGSRLYEAMLIAESKNNIFLDTSFSVHYYKDFSLEKDFAMAYKKVGIDKIIYGSDYPYIEINDSIDFMLEFLQKYNFSSSEIENIMYNNANKLING